MAYKKPKKAQTKSFGVRGNTPRQDKYKFVPRDVAYMKAQDWLTDSDPEPWSTNYEIKNPVKKFTVLPPLKGRKLQEANKQGFYVRIFIVRYTGEIQETSLALYDKFVPAIDDGIYFPVRLNWYPSDYEGNTSEKLNQTEVLRSQFALPEGGDLRDKWVLYFSHLFGVKRKVFQGSNHVSALTGLLEGGRDPSLLDDTPPISKSPIRKIKFNSGRNMKNRTDKEQNPPDKGPRQG